MKEWFIFTSYCVVNIVLLVLIFKGYVGLHMVNRMYKKELNSEPDKFWTKRKD